MLRLAFWSVFAALSAKNSLRSQRTTDAPCSASILPIPVPNLLAPPVTMQIDALDP